MIIITKLVSSIKVSLDFPGGPVVKNPPCHAEEDAGWIPDRGAKIPHATEQLSPNATARVCAPTKTQYDATKILNAETKTEET